MYCKPENSLSFAPFLGHLDGFCPSASATIVSNKCYEKISSHSSPTPGIRRQHKALATEDSYVFWVGRYISSLVSIPPELPSEKKLEIFLTGVALHHNVAAGTQNQAFNAVLFFYKEVLGQPLGNVDELRAERPVHERHAPSISDTRQLLLTIRNVGG